MHRISLINAHLTGSKYCKKEIGKNPLMQSVRWPVLHWTLLHKTKEVFFFFSFEQKKWVWLKRTGFGEGPVSASAPGTEEGPLPSGLPPSCLHPPGQVLVGSTTLGANLLKRVLSRVVHA